MQLDGPGATIVVFLILSNGFGLAAVLLAFGVLECVVWLLDADGSRSRAQVNRLSAGEAKANESVWIYETYVRLEPPRPSRPLIGLRLER